MRIYFDFELKKHFGEPTEMEITPSNREAFDTLAAQFYERLKILEIETLKYNQGYTSINFEDPSNGSIDHIGYPEDLTKKLHESITQSDVSYFLLKTWQILYPGIEPPTS